MTPDITTRSVATGVTLRPMTWHDIPALTAAEADIFGPDAWSAGSWWHELAGRPRRDYVVASVDDALVGYAGVDHGGSTTDVMTIAALSGHRRRGVGALLLAHLMTLARERGAQALLLEVRADNLGAVALYERHGFEVLTVRGRYYQPDNVDALVLRKHLHGDIGDIGDSGDSGDQR